MAFCVESNMTFLPEDTNLLPEVLPNNLIRSDFIYNSEWYGLFSRNNVAYSPEVKWSFGGKSYDVFDRLWISL